MKNLKFSKWCMKATFLIRFGPDREAVSNELRSHMEDHYDALVEKGCEPDEAVELVIRSMGDSQDIAHQLAAIHRPFWGYMLRFSRIALIILLCLSLLPIWNYATKLRFGYTQYKNFDVYDKASYGGDTGRTLHHISNPNVKASSDGSTFTVTDAVIFTEPASDGTEITRFYFRMEQFSWLPWTEQETYFGLYPDQNTVSSQLHAVDSLGNIYGSYKDIMDDQPYIIPNGGQTGLFTYTHECWINGFPATGADWIDIYYTRDGREMCIRIDLSGGDL